ncbi:MAG: 2-polyprenyl-6-methoxyphenol hydroxylase-like oxidoreductase [Chloroflexi bacterium]|nr:2-polyprenyl-6-methoxyphenol hydroxylase-like oxidoreductase [Chloroflexota bacterium]
MNTKPTALVLGAGMAGLWTARVLLDHFDQVVLVEQDELPAQPAFRPGAPQARQYHILLLRGLQIMQQLFPGLDETLLEAGAVRFDAIEDMKVWMGGRWLPQFRSGQMMLSCSRVLVETVMRERLMEHPRLTLLEGGKAVGLVTGAENGSVGGARIRWRERGEEGRETKIRADLVVDATGRNSRAVEWLQQLGYPRPREVVVNSFLGYATRRYRRPHNAPDDWRMLLVSAQPPDKPHGGLVFPEENDIWCVMLAGVNRVYPPTEETGFLEFARQAHPELYEAIRLAEPLSPAYGYRRTDNRRRYFEEMSVWPDGFVVVGDAVGAFNPVYGQGMTISAMTALALDAILAQSNGDLRGVARRFQRQVGRVLDPVWLLATGSDLAWPETEGGEDLNALSARFARWYIGKLLAALPHDQTLRLAFLDVNQLVQPVDSLFRPRVAARVLRHWVRGG